MSYEGHTHFRPGGSKELKEAWHIRLEAYWSFFTGAVGHVTGTDGLWDCWDTTGSKGTRTKRTYSEGLNAPGRNDMQWLVALLDSKPDRAYEPAPYLVVDPRHPDTDKDYICASADVNGAWAFIYSTDGRNITLRMSRLEGPTVSAFWYNPRQGTWHALDASRFSGKQPARTGIKSGHDASDVTFNPPSNGTGKDKDWVLLLETGSAT